MPRSIESLIWLETSSIVDRTVLDDLPPDIQNDEFDAFWKEYG
ncbi:MAG: hypothetical protein ABJM43_13075 [Paracoccaceae bacterium]